MSTVQPLSPSGAALWAQCPRRWWYRYVDRLPEPPPGEPAVLGTFVHAVLELLLDEQAASRTIERARELARVAWAPVEASGDWQALGLDDAAALQFRKRAWATVEAYFSCEQPEAVDPVAQELSVQVEIAGVPFRGFIDLVERDPVGDSPSSVIVTDYKTGKPPVPGKAWSADQEVERMWQPQWYAAALSELGEHQPVRARLLFFNAVDGRSGGFELRTAELAVEVTDESLEGARAELVRRWDDIAVARAAGSAEPQPGPLCGWCPFVDVCVEGRAEVERRWNERNPRTGDRRLRADAPAVAMLGLDGSEVTAEPPLLLRWRAWIDELESLPLDEFEWEGMLECRDALAEWLEINGPAAFAAAVDEIDSRFADMTEVHGEDAGKPWWRQARPTDPDSLAYLEGRY